MRAAGNWCSSGEQTTGVLIAEFFPGLYLLGSETGTVTKPIPDARVGGAVINIYVEGGPFFHDTEVFTFTNINVFIQQNNLNKKSLYLKKENARTHVTNAHLPGLFRGFHPDLFCASYQGVHPAGKIFGPEQQ
jgi:hypothetical protein